MAEEPRRSFQPIPGTRQSHRRSLPDIGTQQIFPAYPPRRTTAVVGMVICFPTRAATTAR